MTGQSWTLDGELQDMSGEDDLEAALKILGLLPSERKLLDLKTLENWAPGGAETYLYHFLVVADCEWSKRYLLKAVVALGPGPTVGAVAEEWIRRRELLASTGVRVPTLYAMLKATILEEYITHPVERFLRESPNSGQLMNSIISYAATLARLRFAPVAPFSDLRTFGDVAIPVDFGEDLGPDSQSLGDSWALYRQLVGWATMWKLTLPPDAEQRYADLLAGGNPTTSHD